MNFFPTSMPAQHSMTASIMCELLLGRSHVTKHNLLHGLAAPVVVHKALAGQFVRRGLTTTFIATFVSLLPVCIDSDLFSTSVFMLRRGPPGHACLSGLESGVWDVKLGIGTGAWIATLMNASGVPVVTNPVCGHRVWKQLVRAIRMPFILQMV
jgi:hypothetical protein